MPRSPRRCLTGERGSVGGSAFVNDFFNSRQRPEKSASFGGSVQMQCM